MTSRGRRTFVGVLTTLLVVLMAPLQPASATSVDREPKVEVRITGLSPTRLTAGSTIVMAGTVTNRGEETWTKAQAYLVMPRTPFTTRRQVLDAVTDGRSYTGERVIDLDSIDELGTLTPGRTVRFRVEVPASSLGLTGAQGVYPVGVQVLATAEDGRRDNAAIARATTFLPRIDGGRAASTPTGVVWSFVMPSRRSEDGAWIDPDGFVAKIATGGQMRHLLDQALAAPPAGTTILLDPALLVGLRDLAEERRLPEGVTLTEQQRASAQSFLDDLVRLARSATCWVLGYDRPDDLAISRSPDRTDLRAAVSRATSSVLAEFGVTGRRVSWPTRTSTTVGLVEQLRGNGEAPVIVSPEAVPQWEPRLGSIVNRPTGDGPVPMLVNGSLDAEVPGVPTVVTIRQRLLSEAALGSLERTNDADSRSDAVVLLDPDWDPGPVVGSTSWAARVYEAPFAAPVDLENLMASRLRTYTGRMPRTTDSEPIDARQVEAAAAAADLRRILAELVTDANALADSSARTVAEVLSVGWRRHRKEGVAVAEEVEDGARRELSAIRVDAPPAVTLSSAEGTFPVTIRNGSNHPISVGVRISSSNAGLAVDDVEPVEVGAGESRTVTVTTDVGSLSSSTFTAQLVTPDGEPVGPADAFNVRTSHVGVAVWVAMGAAALLVVLAMGRRFLLRRRSADDAPEPADD